ncbi:MAG TPA: YceI family protein [Burkholderiales bacterium]|nr:YceI family protein [Burkholderiales bacterium]
MKFPALALLVALALSALPARAANVDYAKSEITFVSKQMNVPVQGRFKKFTAQIAFDPKNLPASKAQVEVDLASIDTGSSEADAEVGKKGWFNTSAFPTAKFVSSSVTQAGPDKFEAKGKLSIKGIGQDVVAPFTAKRTGDTVTYEGGFLLKRLQFKIGEGIWSDTDTVADEVQVKFKIVTTGDK